MKRRMPFLNFSKRLVANKLRELHLSMSHRCDPHNIRVRNIRLTKLRVYYEVIDLRETPPVIYKNCSYNWRWLGLPFIPQESPRIWSRILSLIF